MSIYQESTTSSSLPAQYVTNGVNTKKKMHRLATVRQQQGISLRSVARQMGSTMSVVRSQEDESKDVSISDLRRWQAVLGVPLQDLLVDEEPTLSSPVMERARMVRLMKTAGAIKESVTEDGPRRLATMLVQQLVEMMPELEHVSAWHSVGQRRSLDEYGRIVERRVSDDVIQSE